MFNKWSQRDGVWRNPDFLNLWTSETIVQFGVQLLSVAVPLLAAIKLDASPIEMGVLAASGQAPRLVIGFFAGAFVDRLPRRTVMVVCNVARAVLMAMVPIAAMLGMLTFNVLLILSLIASIFNIFFDAAWAAIIPGLVKREHLTDANGKLMSSVSLAQVVGPAIAGTLVAWWSGPGVIGLTALGFALSALFLARIGRPRPQGAGSRLTGRVLVDEVKEGFHELWRSDVVRPLTTSAAVLNLGGFIFLAEYVLFMTRDLGLSERGVGLVFASGGVGALIGSVMAAPIAARIGVGRSILLGAVAFGVANIGVPLAIWFEQWALPLVIASEFAAWLALMIFNINRFSLRQALTPERLLGRVSSSTMTIVGGAQFVGSLAGGIIGQIWSVHISLYVGVILMAIAAWWVWDSPVPEIVGMPGATIVGDDSGASDER